VARAPITQNNIGLPGFGIADRTFRGAHTATLVG